MISLYTPLAPLKRGMEYLMITRNPLKSYLIITIIRNLRSHTNPHQKNLKFESELINTITL